MKCDHKSILKVNVMENAEEVMQLLEEFTKMKPKDIPRELEEYLGYVAKTGDPVYQWSLVKNLFREKLINVMTDFYESTLTVELPHCPNVDPFNYDRMKTSLLERFDSFSSAPFTVQRICELLTNPRKEYNRADKYMRAIEKNILVVSTREPGTGKRPLECDSQSETVLNGMPDVKPNDSDGSLLHVTTDLPYLGAPPASNDVTVETSEPNTTRPINSELNQESKEENINVDIVKQWPTQESTSLTSESAEEINHISPKKLDIDLSNTSSEVISARENDCDTNNSSPAVDNISNKLSSEEDVSSERPTFSQSSELVLPDSIDSSGSSQDSATVPPYCNLEKEEVESANDENEVSSTPADAAEEISQIQEEIDEPTDSEAEATDTGAMQDAESEVNTPDGEVNSSDRAIEVDEEKYITISEVTATKSDEVDLECNEITGTVDSPVSPDNNSSIKGEDLEDQNINLATTGLLEECDQPDLHPDSSNDVCLQPKTAEPLELESCAEADSMSETNIGLKAGVSESNQELDQNNSEVGLLENTAQVSSPDESRVTEEGLGKSVEDPETSDSRDENIVSEGQCSNSLTGNTTIVEVESSSEVAEDMCDNERREDSVIQSVPNISPDSQQQILIEEISVDPTCEAEEAMDVDDSSNQMMISEGENEVEPMDQCDQIQS